MKWHNFIMYLKELGFEGDGDHLDTVISWLQENGHNTEHVDVRGCKIKLQTLYDERPGQALDVTDAAVLAERDEDVERKVQERIDQLEKQGLVAAGAVSGAKNRAPIHHVHDRLEDDPNLGYPAYEDMGFGLYLHDVRKHAICTREGRLDEIPQRLVKSQQILMRTKQQGLNEFIDSEGGFLTPTQHQNELLRRTYDTGQVFPRARQVQMTSKTLDVPYIVESSRADGSRQGGVRGFWIHEADQLTTSQPAFGKLTMTAWKLACLGYVTEELEEDSQSSVGALQLLGQLFAEELAFKLDDAFIRGDGVGKPLGILNAQALITITKDSTYANAPTPDITAPDIFEMFTRLFPRSRSNAVWFLNPDIEQQLWQANLETTSATPAGGSAGIFLPAGSVAGQPNSTLLGRPIVAIEHCPTATAAGAIILADMTQYLHGMRRGVTTAQSIHIRFDFDEIAFKATMRVDGQPWWQSALTPFQGTATFSPFVTIPAT